jgi:hypothetical protein
MTITYQNYIQEVKYRKNMGNPCYHLVENLLPTCLLSKDVKTKIHKTLILPVVLYACETWSLTLSEEHGLRVFENRVLKRTFGPTRQEVNTRTEKTA